MSHESQGPPGGRTQPIRVSRRREVLRLGAWSAISLAMPVPARAARADDPTRQLIVRNPRPLDAETPTSAFESLLTPNDLFFVRSHFGAPAVGLRPWSLTIDGGVDRPTTLSLDDLEGHRAARTVMAVLQCSGNGRAYFQPRIPGVGWERGAVGNAEWRGVPLATLLESCGIKQGQAHLHVIGSDLPPNPKTPAFLRSIPLEKALEDQTLLATRMNGAPIPIEHGGPLRLIVPGWTGNHWMKWVRRITVAPDEAPGFFQQAGYRLPRVPAPPGAVLKPDDLEPVTWMNVKSLFARPTPGTPLPRGETTVQGVAWTGRGKVTRVELEVDGAWRETHWIDPPRDWGWARWRATWDATPGRHLLRARATDSFGQVQPEVAPWNRSGYLWNGFDRLECEVAADA